MVGSHADTATDDRSAVVAPGSSSALRSSWGLRFSGVSSISSAPQRATRRGDPTAAACGSVARRPTMLRPPLDERASSMPINDPGPRPNAFQIEEATVENDTYRTVAWTGRYLQVTLMSIPAGQSIGLEAHPETDQFLRLESGRGRCVMGPSEDQLDFEQDVSDDWSIQVPAGTWHDVINTGEEPLKLYAVYAPVHHAQGIVQQTAADAERAEVSGNDEPPSWSVQPGSNAPDQHAP